MKKAVLNIFLLVLTITSVSVAYGQDAHFSQYFSSPLYTNPALTGQVEGGIRFNALYRTQWNAFKDNFTTTSFSVDGRVKRFGIGLTVIDQATGINGLNALNFLVSGAYDIFKPGNGTQHLIVGVQGGIYNKSFKGDNVTLPGDWEEGIGYVPGAGDEALDGLSVLSPDINFGILWFDGNPQKRFAPFAGASAFHLLQPEDDFAGDNKLPMRFLIHGGMRYRLQPNFELIPHAKFSYQNGFYNGIAGLNVSYGIIDTFTSIELGAAYRVNDAIVPYVGATYKDFSFGVSYDANVSELTSFGLQKSTFEISLTYLKRSNDYGQQYICPRL